MSAILNIRWLLVFIVGLAEAFIIFSFNKDLLDFFNTVDNKSYSWLGPAFTMLVAAPIVYVVWFFRDSDKRKDQKHVEENIRQLDFHKIEEWATSPRHTNDALQIAAIYQLLPYLKGDYGERFIRPTMEIYRSLLSSWSLTSEDVHNILEQYSIDLTQSNNVVKPDFIKAIQEIFRQELNFFNSFHRNPICFNNNWIPLKNIDLKYSSFDRANFEGINLWGANLAFSDGFLMNFQNANLEFTNFDCAILMGANFQNAYLRTTNFRGARLQDSDFRNANFILTRFPLSQLQESNFSGTCLKRAYFHNANLRNANFKGANLNDANFVSELVIDENTPISDRLFDVNFLEANLENANFKGANLEQAIFAGAKNLDQAIFDHELNYYKS